MYCYKFKFKARQVDGSTERDDPEFFLRQTIKIILVIFSK